MTDLQIVKTIFGGIDSEVVLYYNDHDYESRARYIASSRIDLISESGARDYLIKNQCGKYCANYTECSLEFFKSLRILQLTSSRGVVQNRNIAYFIRCERRRHIHRLAYIRMGGLRALSSDLIFVIMEICAKCEKLESCRKLEFSAMKVKYAGPWFAHKYGIRLAAVCFKKIKEEIHYLYGVQKGGLMRRYEDTAAEIVGQ